MCEQCHVPAPLAVWGRLTPTGVEHTPRALQGLPQCGGPRQGLRGSLLICPRPTRSTVLLLLIILEPASRGHFTALWMQGWGALPCPGWAGSVRQDGAHHQQLVFQHRCFKPEPAWEPPHCGHSCRRAVSHSTWPRARRAARSQHRHIPVGARVALSPLCVRCQFLRDGSWAFLK